MYSVKISEYLPQICVGNEQGTHFLKGEEATLIPAQISLLGCRRDAKYSRPGSLSGKQLPIPGHYISYCVLTIVNQNSSVQATLRSYTFVFCCKKTGKTNIQNSLAKLPGSFQNHILLIEISMKKKETTKNLNDFPLRHILRPRRHDLFFFLFLSQTLWVTYKFYSA